VIIVANTIESMKPCTLFFSAGRYALVSSAVAPVYMKFHPTPSANSAIVKCISSTPDRATPTQPSISTPPVNTTGSAPKRPVSAPENSPGANMPTTCHSMTKAAAS